MARYDDLNTKMIAYAAILSIVILVLLLQGLQALCYNMVTWADQRHAIEHQKTEKVSVQDKMKSDQLALLSGYKKVKVIDESAPAPEKGQPQAMKDTIHIPITEAQEIILRELGSKAGA